MPEERHLGLASLGILWGNRSSFFVRSILYFDGLSVQVVKSLASLCLGAGLYKPWLFADVLNIKVSCTGLNPLYKNGLFLLV